MELVNATVMALKILSWNLYFGKFVHPCLNLCFSMQLKLYYNKQQMRKERPIIRMKI